MFTATLWIIYIETATCTCQNMYLLENHKVNKFLSLTVIVQ